MTQFCKHSDVFFTEIRFDIKFKVREFQKCHFHQINERVSEPNNRVFTQMRWFCPAKEKYGKNRQIEGDLHCIV